jgi:hypothetical protein
MGSLVAGILGEAGLAFGGTRTGGVGPIGGALLFEDGRLGRESVLPISDIACGRGPVCKWAGQVAGKKGIYPVGAA